MKHLIHSFAPVTLILALALAVACGADKKKKPSAKTKAKTQAPDRPMKKWVRVDYRPGHPLTPKAALLAWFKKNARKQRRRRLFMIPTVVITKNGFGLSRDRAFIGSSAKDPGTNKLHLKLDDSALGISLNSHLQHLCGKTAKTCALWLEGHWGPHLRGSPRVPWTDGKGAKRYPFAVRKVGGKVIEKYPTVMIAR